MPKPLPMWVLSSSAHDREQRASECKPVGSVPGKGTSKRAQSGKRVQARAAFPADRVASGSQSAAAAGSKSLRWFSSLLVMALLALPVSAHAKCRTPRCWHRVHVHRQNHWLRHHIWQYRWHHLSAWEQQWTRCISFRESRNRRVARESGHWSYFQWTLDTWHAAGGNGNPETHNWTEQAVRAVRWAHVAGSAQWSTSTFCGSV